MLIEADVCNVLTSLDTYIVYYSVLCPKSTRKLTPASSLARLARRCLLGRPLVVIGASSEAWAVSWSNSLSLLLVLKLPHPLPHSPSAVRP